MENQPDYKEIYKDKKYVNLDRVSTFRKIKDMAEGNKALLDIGCGTGYLLNFLGGGKGIDINEDLIKEAKKSYPENDFFVSPATDIPLDSNNFDVVVMCMIIEHIEHPEEALLEAKRLLKEDGTLIVVTPRKNDFFYKHFVDKDPTHVREYTTKELKELVSRFFTVEDVKFGTASTKIPGWATFLMRSDIIIKCKNT